VVCPTAADDDDQAAVGVDDNLVVGGVPVVLRLLGDRVVAGGHQGAVHDEHGVLRETLSRLESEQGTEMVDDAVCSRLGYAEQRGELAHRQVRAPVTCDQRQSVLQGQAPWPPPADGASYLAPQYGHQLVGTGAS